MRSRPVLPPVRERRFPGARRSPDRRHTYEEDCSIAITVDAIFFRTLTPLARRTPRSNGSIVGAAPPELRSLRPDRGPNPPSFGHDQPSQTHPSQRSHRLVGTLRPPLASRSALVTMRPMSQKGRFQGLLGGNAVGVAQVVRAPDCGSGGRGFKSPRRPQCQAGESEWFAGLIPFPSPLAALRKQCPIRRSGPADR